MISIGVAGCNRPAASTALVSQPQQHPTPDSLPSGVTAVPAGNPLDSSTPLSKELVQAPQAPGFKNQAANEAWNQYVDDYEAVKSVPVPELHGDVINNPDVVTNHLNELGRRLQLMQESRATVQSNLTSPEDKKRFQAAEKSLIESQNQQ